ncbi:MAG: glycosyltransferase family 39 protein [bacterium]|nr:glycosyltransferase family 39 protein [bacterium]
MLALAALLLFVGLGAYPLWDPDEGRHALIARNLWAATDWRGMLLPRLHGRPYHDKPILYYWLTAVAYALGGPTTVAARWVSACSALATVGLVFWFALRAWGLAAAVAAATMLVTALGFLGLGRFSSLDMLLTVAVTSALVALYAWSREEGPRTPLALAGVALGVGLLAKGAVAPVLVGAIVVVHLATTGRVRLLRGRSLLVVALPCLVVAGPWYVAAAWLDPAYLSEFLVRHHLKRFLAASERLHPAPFWYTPVFALAVFWPWSALLPAVVRDGRERGLDEAQRFCLIWAAAVVAFFTVSSGKLATYVLPAMPALALLGGRVLAEAARRRVSEPTRRLVRGGLVVASGTWIVAGAGLLAAGLARITTPFPQRAALAVASVAIACVLARLARRAPVETAAAGLVGAVMATAAAFYGLVVPGLEARFSDAPLARLIRACDPAAVGPVLVWGDTPDSLAFYLDRPTHRIERPRDLRHVLARRDRVFVVAGLGQVEDLQRMTGDALDVAARGRHVLLTARTLAAGATSGSRACAAGSGRVGG